jgi:putative ABC transport system ATP-binding protein
MAMVRVQHLVKTYQQGDIAVPALRGVNLEIQPAEFTAMVGPSGSGKTTLLNQIGGLDKPTSGEIFLDDQPMSRLNRQQLTHLRLWKVGFIFQEYNLVPVLTALENVEYVMMLQGIKAAQRRDRAYSILLEVGLKGLENRRPSELSGGQQQRVAVARAMVTQPAVVLADEPTANLDSETGAALLDLMRDLNHKHGMTFLFSTHDPMVMERAKRILRMVDGQIQQDELKSTSLAE